MGGSVGVRGTVAILMLSIGFGISGSVLAQHQTVGHEENQDRHDQDDALLDVKLKLDDFVSELWVVGLNYDCSKVQRRIQKANFTRKFGWRIDLVFEKVKTFGPDVASHGHDAVAIGRCLKLPKGGGALPANSRRFEASLKSFENFLAQRKTN